MGLDVCQGPSQSSLYWSRTKSTKQLLLLFRPYMPNTYSPSNNTLHTVSTLVKIFVKASFPWVQMCANGHRNLFCIDQERSQQKKLLLLFRSYMPNTYSPSNTPWHTVLNFVDIFAHHSRVWTRISHIYIHDTVYIRFAEYVILPLFVGINTHFSCRIWLISYTSVHPFCPTLWLNLN
jgi:hypothetical protein